MLVMIGAMGFVFGTIFNSPMQEFLPFLAIGLIFWNYITSSLMEGSGAFVAYEAIIKQLPIPLMVHVARVIWRNTIILFHNFLIIPLLLVLFAKPLTLNMLLMVPGFILLVLNISWVSLLLALVCSRYRDLPQVISSLLQVVFYLTPIVWMPSLLPGRFGQTLLNLNPIFHLLEIVRAPILGINPSASNWMVSVGLLFFGWILTLAFYGRYKSRVAFWV
jgi:lipopolysaccharide transport system permease protein